MDTPIIPQDTPYNDFVYEPAEDSFLLLDVLESDLPKYFDKYDHILSLEMGCGSGSISTAVAKFLYDKVLPYIFAIDINPSACYLSNETARINGMQGRVETIIADGLKPCFNNILFDLIICNPPYVPVFPAISRKSSGGSTCEEFQGLEKSWDGGPDGNSFIVPFLKDLPKILAPGGALYLLLCSWNNPEELMEKYATPQGFCCKLLEKRIAGRERLSVWRLSNKSTISPSPSRGVSGKLASLSEAEEAELKFSH